jgi:hypothetical protein
MKDSKFVAGDGTKITALKFHKQYALVPVKANGGKLQRW